MWSCILHDSMKTISRIRLLSVAAQRVMLGQSGGVLIYVEAVNVQVANEDNLTIWKAV